MNTLEESLLILRKLSLEIGFRTVLLLKGDIFKVQGDKNDKQKNIMFTTLLGMNIIDICSYLDEYEKIFGIKTENEFQTRILLIKTICKPVIKEIKKWSDLKKIRNWMVAHNLRINKGKMFYNQLTLDYKVPKTIVEIELLSNCIQIINYVISSEFAEELTHASKQKIAKVKDKEFLTKKECWNIINHLITEVNLKLVENSKPYRIKLNKKVSLEAKIDDN